MKGYGNEQFFLMSSKFLYARSSVKLTEVLKKSACYVSKNRGDTSHNISDSQADPSEYQSFLGDATSEAQIDLYKQEYERIKQMDSELSKCELRVEGHNQRMFN